MEVWTLRDVILAYQEGKLTQDEAIERWTGILNIECGEASKEFGFMMVVKVLRVILCLDMF